MTNQTMDKAKVSKIKARIQRAKRSFNVGGDFLLQFEIDGMSLETMQALQAGLLQGRVPVSYKYLDDRIAKLQVKAA